MLIKLLKHELKATYKIFLLIFAVILFLTLANILGIQTENVYILGLSMAAAGLAVLPIIVVYAVTILQRYYNNLYGEEGYLTFTLPVKSWEIILSKYINALIWGVLTVLVGGICFVLLLLVFLRKEVDFSLIQLIQECFKVVDIGFLFNIFLLLFFAIACFIMRVYFVISLSNLPFIKRFNILIAIIAYFIVERIESKIGDLFLHNITGGFLENAPIYNIRVEYFMELISKASVVAIFITIIFIILYFLGTSYITSHKLHIK